MSAAAKTHSLDRQILTLALPAIGSGVTVLAHHWIDTYWVGRHLGESAVAALSVAAFTVWIFSAIGSLVSIGLTALVARYVGAGKTLGARYVASQGLRSSALLAIVLGGVGWVAAPLVFSAAHTSPDVTEAGLPYVRYFWLGGFVFLTQLASDAIFRGHGITWIPFVTASSGLVLNAVLDPLLILGYGPIPRLGVAGAAIATLVAQAMTVLLSLWILRHVGFLGSRRPDDEELRLTETTRLGEPGWLGIDLAVFLRMGRVGLPMSCAGVLFAVIYIAVSRIVEHAGGTAALAGLGIGIRVEALGYVISMGYSAAAASLVGRYLGRGDPDGAARVSWRAVLQCSVPCGVWAVVLFCFDEPLASFLIEPGVAHSHARDFLRIISFYLVPMAGELVLEGAFGGAGMTVPPMIIMISMTVIRIPIAIWAAFYLDAGVVGIWWTISLTAILRGVFMAVWFSRGTWKERTV